MEKRRDKYVEPSKSGELTPRQQTLIIGGLTTVCGNCNGNADPTETSHEMTQMAGGPGCGVEWKHVTTDGIDSSYGIAMRPDLEWIEPDYGQDGVTVAMEETMIGNLRVIGFIDPEEL
jgi:hypothetical protein